MIGLRECAGDCGVGPILFLNYQKCINGFAETSLKQAFVSREWNAPFAGKVFLKGKIKPVNGVKEEECPDPLV
jgi:hypothetical protein